MPTRTASSLLSSTTPTQLGSVSRFLNISGDRGGQDDDAVMTVMLKKARRKDPSRTQENILDVATEEFARNGLAGGRIDQIAALTQTSKRMIYYYFGSKEGLNLAVLERAYRKIRSVEADLQLDALAPDVALTMLISSTFDHYEANPLAAESSRGRQRCRQLQKSL